MVGKNNTSLGMACHQTITTPGVYSRATNSFCLLSHTSKMPRSTPAVIFLDIYKTYLQYSFLTNLKISQQIERSNYSPEVIIVHLLCIAVHNILYKLSSGLKTKINSLEVQARATEASTTTKLHLTNQKLYIT